MFRFQYIRRNGRKQNASMTHLVIIEKLPWEKMVVVDGLSSLPQIEVNKTYILWRRFYLLSHF